MKLGLVICRALTIAILATASPGESAGATAVGGVTGTVRLSGKPPGNRVIRMGMDPMCSKVNRGKQTVQEAVVATRDGSLANVFVTLQGTFPETTIPREPVTVDQRDCIYVPRVVGVRVGQTLLVRNSDDWMHNVHGLSAHGNGFNVGQPRAGITHRFTLEHEEQMLQIKCDMHRWMVTYVGVVDHPYLAVSSTDGTFQIANVPVGNYTLTAWHEEFGRLSQSVRVRADGSTTAEFLFSQKP